MKSVFQCEKCGSLFDTPQKASFCELQHLEPDGMVVLEWSKPPNSWLPKTIRVRVKPPGGKCECDVWSVYHLDEIALKGL